jgi:Transposase
MDYFAGLDVSVKDTSVCIVDDTGRIAREVKVASEPDALLAVLTNPTYRFKRIGLEAGPLSQWLFSALTEAGLPVICVETRHMRAVLKAQINKTDRNDARGIAQMMRVGLYRRVHVKPLRSQKLRMLLTHRKLLQSKAIAVDNDLRGTLRNFGLKVGVASGRQISESINTILLYSCGRVWLYLRLTLFNSATHHSVCSWDTLVHCAMSQTMHFSCAMDHPYFSADLVMASALEITLIRNNFSSSGRGQWRK